MANPAPPNRPAAASKALGAPGGAPRYLNRGTGRMEALRGGRFPGQRGRAPARAGRMPGRQAPGRAPSRAPTNIENIPLQQLTPGQIGQRATHLGGLTEQAELGPLRRQYGEVSGQEGRSQALYNQYSGQAQTMLGGILGQQEANAKTFENRMADNALAAGKGIETSGQQQATLSGGFLTPQVKAELAAEGQRAAATGGAGNTAAAQMGFNAQNYINSIRAASATRAGEGPRSIAGAYAKQLGAIGSKEIQSRERLAPNIARIRGELEKTQFNQRATSAQITGKKEALEAGERKSLRSAGVSRANAQEGNATRAAIAAAKLGLEGKKLQADEAWKNVQASIDSGKLNVSQMDANTRRAYDRWRASPAGKASTTKGPAKEGSSWRDQIEKLSGIAREAGLRPGVSGKARADAWRNFLGKAKGAAKKGTIIQQSSLNAAANVAQYGYLSKGDQAIANANGLKAEYAPAGWFR